MYPQDLDLERRFNKMLAKFRDARFRNPRLRPFVVESWGLPKALKTTINNSCEHFINRAGWRVSAPPEGPEVIRTPFKRTPIYNFSTFWYSMTVLHQHMDSLWEGLLQERGPLDHVGWLEYWFRKGEIDADTKRKSEEYALQPFLLDQYDLHICFVADPEVALKREVANSISTHDGDTMNPASMASLLDIYKQMRERFDLDSNPKMRLIDTTHMTAKDAALTCLGYICEAFERRIKTL